MKQALIKSLAKSLRDQRAVLFKEVADTEADLQFLAEDREAELEERAQHERSARLFDRLDLRGKREIELIDEALQRMSEDSFGVCTVCEERIPEARLRAVPWTPYCVACATEIEKSPRAEEAEEEPAAPSTPGVSQLSDVELRREILELIREDGRVDTDELRVLCRHGVVILDGAIPSTAEQAILRKLITDIVGVREIRDQLRVSEVPWERADRAKPVFPEEKASRFYEPPASEDLVETLEDGTDYTAPSEPPADEE